MSTAAVATPINRYADNTSSKPVDRVRRLGFSAGMPQMIMMPGGSNQQGEFIPQGKLIVFKPHVEPAYDGDFEFAPVENSPKHYADNLAAKFHNGENDWGYRTLDFLTSLPYDKQTGFDDADRYFAVVYPAIQCEMGLEVVKPGMNYDDPMPCPTCRKAWLESAELETAINTANGLNRDILTQLKDTIKNANEACLAFMRFKLQESETEIQKAAAGQPALKVALSDVDYHLMAALHKKPSHIEQAEIMSAQTRDMGKAIAAGIVEAQGGIPAEELERYERFKRFEAMESEVAPATVPVSLEAVTSVVGETETGICAATKKDDTPCPKKAVNGTAFCQFHQNV